MSNDDDDNDDKGQGVISPLVSIALRKRGMAGRGHGHLYAQSRLSFSYLCKMCYYGAQESVPCA